MATQKVHPLSFMQRLSGSVFVYRPNESTNSTATAPATVVGNGDPWAILVLGWMDARDNHLAWVVQKHRTLFPRSSVVLVKARTAGLMFAQLGRRDAQPAVAPLRAILGDSEASGPPRLLVHAFSGGGSSSLYHLYGLFGDAPLPPHVTVFDSTPGVWSYSFASNVFTAGIPKGLLRTLVAVPLAHLIAVVSWLLVKVLRVSEDNQKTWSDAHNSPLLNHEVRRAYIYSDVDRIVLASAIEAHADEAEAKGFVVTRALFAGSGHVAHSKNDPERYWRIVRETWPGRATG